MKRGSPYCQLASSAQRGNHTPACQECAASIQERRWNSKSCPEAYPFQKKGETMAKARAALSTVATATGQRSTTDAAAAVLPELDRSGKRSSIQNHCWSSNPPVSQPARWQPAPRASVPNLGHEI